MYTEKIEELKVFIEKSKEETQSKIEALVKDGRDDDAIITKFEELFA